MPLLDPTGIVSLDVALLRGASWKLPVRCATTANITILSDLNVGDVIDGVTLAAGDRVLVKNQTAGAENGIYVAGGFPLRSFDMDQDATTSVVPSEEIMGAVVRVTNGTVNGGTFWQNTNTSPPILNSTSLTFSQFGAPVAVPIQRTFTFFGG